MDDSTAAPSISIVIPVYNEEAILRAALVELIDSLDVLGLDYEIILRRHLVLHPESLVDLDGTFGDGGAHGTHRSRRCPVAR